VTHGPNSRGAKDHGILPNFGPNYVRLNGRSGKGRRDWPSAGIKVLFIHEPSPLYAFDPTDQEMDWLRGVQTVIYHRFKPSTLDQVAHVIIPGHGFPEKDGTVTNMEGRVQLLDEGIDAPGIWHDWRVFQEIANALGARWDYDILDQVAADLRKALPKYSDTRAGSIVLWGDQE
jgi:NADH dehydrogenase/NADH:ubiquinone oxidoreductase subunit G